MGANFKIPRLTAHILVPLLVGLAALWIHFAPPTQTEALPPLRLQLPAELGSYTGSSILHCQNERCRQAFKVRDSEPLNACTTCGSTLDPVSLAEKQILPSDTTIVRRSYDSAFGPVYGVTIVLAGADSRSIHRPQQCLPGQGYTIDRETVIPIQLAGGRQLKVKKIDTHRGPGASARFGYIYWFVGPYSQTPSHYTRLFHTMWDRLFRQTLSRWAYISINTGEPLETPESIMRLSNFLNELLPAIETKTAVQP